MSEAMQKNLKEYRTALARIRGNRDLSDEAKKRMIDEIYSAANEVHRRIVDESRAKSRRAFEEASSGVFGAPVSKDATDADKTAVRASYRDALFRVSAVEDADQLSRLQEMASQTGDKLLERALLYRGYETGNQHLVNAICDRDPELEGRWNNLMEKASETGGDAFHDSMYAPPKPEDVPTGATEEVA